MRAEDTTVGEGFSSQLSSQLSLASALTMSYRVARRSVIDRLRPGEGNGPSEEWLFCFPWAPEALSSPQV